MPDYSVFYGFSEEEKTKNMQTFDNKRKISLAPRRNYNFPGCWYI